MQKPEILDPPNLGRMREALRPRAGVNQESPACSRHSIARDTIRYLDSVIDTPAWKRKMRAYYSNTSDYLSRVVPPNKKVLLIGCLTSELLECMNPSVGVALDASEKATRLARAGARRPGLHFVCGLPERFETTEKFDYVVLLNYVDHSSDVLALMDSLKRFVHEDSRIIISMLNPMWHSLVRFASYLKIRVPDYRRNLVSSRLLSTALEIKQFRVTEVSRRVLVPKRIPLLAHLFNQYLGRLPLLNRLCFMQFVTAQPVHVNRESRLSCSVIIPCYNEEGNIAECIRRVPSMGTFTEIVVVNDGSKDGTQRVVEGLLSRYSNLTLVTYPKNKGKGLAVQEGLKACKGDVMMILDADMTVPPEELTDFFEALDSGAADFASGTRFLYPMEKEAMRLANYFGNILFSKLLEIIVGSPCSDTLCGTKAMRKRDFSDFRIEDKAWGDFDLIFHAAKRKLRNVEIPVHYKNRVAGESKMKAFSSGLSFLQLCLRKWGTLP